MKKFFLLPLLLLLMLSFVKPASAQRFLGGISVGANFTQVDGDQFYGFRHVGLNFGPMAILPFGKKKQWSVSMELLYSQKGSYHKGNTDTTYYHLNLNYIDIPVMVHFTDKEVISAGVGFCYGQLVGKKESTLPDSIMVPNSNFLPYDLSVLGEVSLRLWNRLWINVRYQYSMISLRTVTYKDPYNQLNTWERKEYNNLITVRLTYIFNQELRGKPKKPKGDEE